MTREARFEVTHTGVGTPDSPTDKFVFIVDLGPHDTYLSVTNGAEGVIDTLRAEGYLDDVPRVFYIDEGEEYPTELLYDDVGFTRFNFPGR
jgi:hypothetical protein